MNQQIKPSMGIPWCINCIGLHPDEVMTKEAMLMRLLNPQKAVMKQLSSYEAKRHIYRSRACTFCGRVYDHNGDWFDAEKSWERTARLVSAELMAAGIQGVDEPTIKLIVAECVRSSRELIKSIPQFQAIVRSGKGIHPDDLRLFETMPFAGRLNLIIDGIQEGRTLKLFGTERRPSL